jgi:8-hydroxy-5-deazaflavin:NADPH oxidoreductase
LSAPVPIIGATGWLGYGLALRLAAGGTPVVIGSRRPDAADYTAGRLREELPDAQVEGLPNQEAATRGPIVILAVPFSAQVENLTNLAKVLEPGQIVVDTTVPLAAAVGGRPTRLLGVPQGSAGQQAQEIVPDGVIVVSAFHTVNADNLTDLSIDLDEDIPVASDKKDAKRAVAELIRRIPGLRPVDCGRLEAARLIEGMTPVLIGVSSRHKTHAGVKITGLPDELW